MAWNSRARMKPWSPESMSPGWGFSTGQEPLPAAHWQETPTLQRNPFLFFSPKHMGFEIVLLPADIRKTPLSECPWAGRAHLIPLAGSSLSPQMEDSREPPASYVPPRPLCFLPNWKYDPLFSSWKYDPFPLCSLPSQIMMCGSF